MVVDGLEVFRFHGVGADARVGIELAGHVPYHVLHELGIVVGVLGDVLLVGSLQQAVEFAGSLLFHQVDDVLDPDEVVTADGDRHVGTLIVRTPLGDGLGAGAEAGHGDHHTGEHAGLAVLHFADERDLVVEQALHTGHGRGLLHEEGKGHLDVPRLGLEPFYHLHQHLLEGVHRDLPLVLVEDLHEAGHVRALEVVGQENVHVEGGDGVLLAFTAVPYPYRVADILDAHAVDGDLAGIRAPLDVFDFGGSGIAVAGHRTGRSLEMEAGYFSPPALFREIPIPMGFRMKSSKTASG